MGFVYPFFLFALLTIAIPIIIHLFHFRRFKTVYFTNVRFLKEVQEQTTNRQKIRNLLVLLSRILAIIFLVLAFAQPFIRRKGVSNQLGAKDVSIYLDNSFSMTAESDNVRLLEKGRSRAEEIIAAYGPDDRIQILTSDFEGRDQRLLSKDDALTRLREIKSSYQVKDLSKVISRQKQILKGGQNKIKEVYVISDFQKNSFDLKKYEDPIYKLNLIPLASFNVRNVAIDSAWFESPVQSLNQPNALIVKIKNNAETEASNLRLSLTLNGELRPGGILNIPANNTVYDTINVTINKTGWYEAKLNLTDYPIEFDNDYYFTFYVKEKVNVLEIHSGVANRFIQASFKNNEYFIPANSSVGQLDFSKFKDYDLLIINDLKSISSGFAAELKNYIESGGNVFILPAKEINLNEYNAFFNSLNANEFSTFDKRDRVVSYVNYQDFIFNDVFDEKKDNLKLPSTKSNFKFIQKASNNEEVLLKYRDGQSFLSKYLIGLGNLFVCAAPIDTDISDLVKNAEIFVPMLYRMALATGKDRKVAYIIGVENSLESDNKSNSSESVFRMGNASGEFIPEQRRLGNRLKIGINNQIKEAGFYNLYLDPKELLDKFAFNYDRRESAMDFVKINDLKKIVGEEVTIIDGTYSRDFKGILASEKKGIPLWKWCLLLTLVFLATETLLLRLMGEKKILKTTTSDSTKK